MENNPNTKKKKEGDKKTPKFNLYWIYGIVLVALLAGQFYNFSGKVPEITEYVFLEDYLKDGEVESVLLINMFCFVKVRHFDRCIA